MKPCIYTVRTDTVNDDENIPHTVYGIEIPSRGISIPDIFTDKNEAENFCDLCNRLDLSPLHIYDLIEDIL